MTAFISDDAKMRQAYEEGKDLYAMIAQSAYHNNYEDNLEYYPEGSEIEVDGKKTIAGTGQEFKVETDDQNSITIKYYELVETPNGDVVADALNIGDKVMSDIGELTIASKTKQDNKITFVFSM